MADTSLGTAVLRTKLDATGLKTGLTQAKTETEKFAADSVTAVKGIGAAIGAVAASQGLRAYIGFMRSAAVEAQQATASAALFQKALQRNNQSASDGAAMVQRLADKFGVVNSVVEESATFMLRQGASIDDVERALTAAGASAAAAGFDISTAFNNVGVAVATGRSQLLETSGIVANLGPVAQAYAKSVGKTVEQLTQQELIQARVNAIYEETKSEIEDVDILLKGLPKSQAEVTREFTRFRQSAGDLAQAVIVPLNNALSGALRVINDLPEPVKQGAIAMAGAATAGIALATGITAIKTALNGLSALGLLSFGPAGWIVLGVAAVAGLAVALSGQPSSLDRAVQNAQKALSGGDKTSMVSALDDVVSKLEGSVKTAFQNLRDDIAGTADDAVEAAAKTARAFAMMDELVAAQKRVTAAQSAYDEAIRSNRGLGASGVAVDAEGRVAFDVDRELQSIKDKLFAMGEAAVVPFVKFNEELRRFELTAPADVLAGLLDPEGVRRVVEGTTTTVQNIYAGAKSALHAAENELAAAQADLNARLARINEPIPGTPTPTPTTPSTGTPDAKRTWQMVLDDLDRAGKEAMRRAAFEGTDEAFREAARKRVTLIDDAITEALTTFYGQVSPQELGALAARRARAEHEARIPVAAGTPPDPAGLAALKAQADAIMADTLQANRDARLQELRETLAHNSSLRQQALAIMADTRQAQADARAAEEAQRAYVDSLNDSEAELGRWLATADRLTVSIKAANDETARMGLFADALKKYGSGREGLAGTSAADRTGGRFPDRDAAAAMLRDTVVATVDAFREGKVGVAEVQAAVDAWTSVMPQSVKAINELTEGILQLDRAAQDAARTAMQNELAPLWTPSSGTLPIVKDFTHKFERSLRDGWKAPGDASNGVQRSNVITWQDAQRTLQAQEDAAAAAAKAQQDAADRFASTVISAGFSFGDAAVKAFQDGDIVGVIRAGLSGAGSIFSGLDAKDSNILGTIGLFGGTLGIGSLIAGGLGLIGTLIGALTGGGREAEERRRDEASRARSVPAVNINFTVNQSNTYNGAPRDPANEQAFARQADTLFESIYRRHLGPRLDRIEQRLGIAGA